MASVVVVATGAALAVSVPFVALKEMLEKRSRFNMNKHLGSKTMKCRVNFGSVEDMYAEEYLRQMNNKEQNINKENYSSDDDEDRASIASSPPHYDDLFQPPPYDSTELAK